MPTLLTLTPAFGGARYGPFTSGNVSIGSDPQCQVLASAALGVLPLHAWVTERPGGWTLHPGVPGAVLFVSRKGGRHAPVSGPVELAAGDGFALGTKEGVAFVIGGGTAASTPARPASGARPGAAPARPTIAGPQAPPRRASTAPRRGVPTAGAFADEARRMAEVELMRQGPIQAIRQAMFRYNTGVLFQPRYILGALFAAASGGFVMCTGVVGWVLAHM